jgi:hypothetical protein
VGYGETSPKLARDILGASGGGVARADGADDFIRTERGSGG